MFFKMSIAVCRVKTIQIQKVESVCDGQTDAYADIQHDWRMVGESIKVGGESDRYCC